MYGADIIARMQQSFDRRAGLGLALASALAFGGSGVAAKPLIEQGMDSLHVVWLRIAGAALVLLPLAWRHRALVRERPALLAGFGVLAVAGVQAFYFAAIARIPVGVGLLIEFFGPALVLGWVRFVQRRPVTRQAAVGVLFAVTGLACVVEVWAGLGFDPLGLLLAFGAACCQCAYFVLAGHGSDSADGAAPHPLGVIAYGLIVGAVVLTLVSRPWNLDWSLLGERAELGDMRPPAWTLILWIVLVTTVLAYLFGVLAVRRLSPPVAGVVACLEAVVASVLAWVLLAEHLGAAQIVGGALVLIGAFTAQLAAPAPGSGERGEPVAGNVPRPPDDGEDLPGDAPAASAADAPPPGQPAGR
ncbi:EamA family transporter [Streptomyces sp. B8F3]|uniref:EamA family transporter n=1 Tax=unclassified Streptomyces TaxID=2593676 RepID=UPI00325EA8C4